MTFQKPSRIIWTLDISADDAAIIAEHCAKEWTIVPFTLQNMPAVTDFELSPPQVVFFSQNAATVLNDSNGLQKRYSFLLLIHRVLLLKQCCTQVEVTTLTSNLYTQIQQTPLSKNSLLQILAPVIEESAIQHDLCCMAQEVSLNRDLLNLKHNAFNFLMSFTKNAANCKSLSELFQFSHAMLQEIAPVDVLQGAIYKHSLHQSLNTKLYLSSASNTPVEKQWVQFLTEKAQINSAQHIQIVSKECFLPLPNKVTLPDQQLLWMLPLESGLLPLGFLALQLRKSTQLSKDNMQALISMLKHFGAITENLLSNQLANQQVMQPEIPPLGVQYMFKKALLIAANNLLTHKIPVSVLKLQFAFNNNLPHSLEQELNSIQKQINKPDTVFMKNAATIMAVLNNTDHQETIAISKQLDVIFNQNNQTGGFTSVAIGSANSDSINLESAITLHTIAANLLDLAQSALEQGIKNSNNHHNVYIAGKINPPKPIEYIALSA